jgi:hypothetical protein
MNTNSLITITRVSNGARGSVEQLEGKEGRNGVEVLLFAGFDEGIAASEVEEYVIETGTGKFKIQASSSLHGRLLYMDVHHMEMEA